MLPPELLSRNFRAQPVIERQRSGPSSSVRCLLAILFMCALGGEVNSVVPQLPVATAIGSESPDTRSITARADVRVTRASIDGKFGLRVNSVTPPSATILPISTRGATDGIPPAALEETDRHQFGRLCDAENAGSELFSICGKSLEQSGHKNSSLGPDLSSNANPKGLNGPEIFASIPIRTSSRAIKTLVRTAELSHERLPNQCFEAGFSHNCSVQIPDRWRSLVKELSDLSDLEKLRQVNTEVNVRIAYRSDIDNYGAFDYWASAMETMHRSAGDCEDFAILKMWLLINLGLNPSDLYVVVVRSQRLAVQHAVLVIRLDGRFLIMDNLVREVSAANEIEDYLPVFSVNARSIWLHGFPAAHEVAALEGGPRAQQ